MLRVLVLGCKKAIRHLAPDAVKAARALGIAILMRLYHTRLPSRVKAGLQIFFVCFRELNSSHFGVYSIVVFGASSAAPPPPTQLQLIILRLRYASPGGTEALSEEFKRMVVHSCLRRNLLRTSDAKYRRMTSLEATLADPRRQMYSGRRQSARPTSNCWVQQCLFLHRAPLAELDSWAPVWLLTRTTWLNCSENVMFETASIQTEDSAFLHVSIH